MRLLVFGMRIPQYDRQGSDTRMLELLQILCSADAEVAFLPLDPSLANGVRTRHFLRLQEPGVHVLKPQTLHLFSEPAPKGEFRLDHWTHPTLCEGLTVLPTYCFTRTRTHTEQL